MRVSTLALSILIVDDDRIFRQAVENALRAEFMGADLVLAEDGVLGLEQCRRRPFDLIVTDMRMPRMTGIEMLADVRKSAIHTPAIVVSSSELPPGDLSKAGAFLYLPKHELHLLPDFARRLLESRAA